MKSIIIYGSHHHGNTKKVIDAIAAKYQVELCDAEEAKVKDLRDYDIVGFASGMDFGKFYPAVTEIAKTIPAGKHVYGIYTCARKNDKSGMEIKEIAEERMCIFHGIYGCLGYNTYGPWKIIGGMNKSHPSQEELEEAVKFYERVLMEADHKSN